MLGNVDLDPARIQLFACYPAARGGEGAPWLRGPARGAWSLRR